jgi:hypothetical protein
MGTLMTLSDPAAHEKHLRTGRKFPLMMLIEVWRSSLGRNLLKRPSR